MILHCANQLARYHNKVKEIRDMNKKLLHTPEGVRDIYGKEYTTKLFVETKLHDMIEKYGYEDIQTPSFEFFDIFSKDIGTTPSKDLYKFFDKDGETIVLRSDFTPSIARCAAKYFMEEKGPIRFCYMGNTFSSTSSLQGKLSEVTQIGAELINDDSVQADAEMLSMVVESLKNTGLEKFQLSIGHVDFFRGLCEEAGLDADTEDELRDYISGKNYFAAENLLRTKKVAEPYQSNLLKMTDVFGNLESLKACKEWVKNEVSLSAIERLEAIYEVLKLYGVEAQVTFDLGLLSQYDYYTGIVFKAYTYGIGDAIVKGGRYNHLLQKFGKDAAAIGFVVVVDDMMEALKRQKVDLPIEESKKVLTYNAENYKEQLKAAIEYRKNDQAVELVPER